MTHVVYRVGFRSADGIVSGPTTESMDRLKNEAEHLRFGVCGGWLNVAQAVAWADDQIAQSVSPHPALLDVALARNRSREEVAALLDAVPGTADLTGVMRQCLADLLELVERQTDMARDVAKWLEVAANEGFLPASEFGGEPTELDDEFALAERGVCGTVLEAQERLVAFLRLHARRDA